MDSDSDSSEIEKQNIKIKIRKKTLVSKSEEMLENCKNLQSQLILPSTQETSESSRDESITTSKKTQEIKPIVKSKETTKERREKDIDSSTDSEKIDINNNRVLDLTVKPKHGEISIGMDPRNIGKERINTHEAHAELIFKNHLSEPMRLRKINDLMDTMRELENRKSCTCRVLSILKLLES